MWKYCLVISLITTITPVVLSQPTINESISCIVNTPPIDSALGIFELQYDYELTVEAGPNDSLEDVKIKFEFFGLNEYSPTSMQLKGMGPHPSPPFIIDNYLPDSIVVTGAKIKNDTVTLKLEDLTIGYTCNVQSEPIVIGIGVYPVINFFGFGGSKSVGIDPQAHIAKEYAVDSTKLVDNGLHEITFNVFVENFI